MKFFIPAAKDEKQTGEAYEAIRKFMIENCGPLLPNRYYEIHYRHDGKDIIARVGEPNALTAGEIVVAILRAEAPHGPFLVCTPNRGVQRGEPILASGDARSVEFD